MAQGGSEPGRPGEPGTDDDEDAEGDRRDRDGDQQRGADAPDGIDGRLDRVAARQGVDYRVAAEVPEDQGEDAGDSEAEADRPQRLAAARPGQVDREPIEQERQQGEDDGQFPDQVDDVLRQRRADRT